MLAADLTNHMLVTKDATTYTVTSKHLVDGKVRVKCSSCNIYYFSVGDLAAA